MEYVSKKILRNALFNGEHNLYAWEEIEAKIDAIPAADVAPVVRCTECKYNNACLTQSFVEDASRIPFDRNTFFCADGVRQR